MATPGTHNLPEHQHGTSWGYHFDFSEFGPGYLTGATRKDS